MRHCIIINGEVANTILWDGKSPLALREGETLLPESECENLPRVAPPQEDPKPSVDVGGLKLASANFDQGEIAKVAVLYLIADKLGAAPETVPISDVDGKLHELPAATFLQVVAGYGQAIHDEWTAKKKAEPNNTKPA